MTSKTTKCTALAFIHSKTVAPTRAKWLLTELMGKVSINVLRNKIDIWVNLGMESATKRARE